MATIPAPDSSARGLRLSLGLRELVIVAASLAIFGIVVFNPRALNDGDTYWPLASGAWTGELLEARARRGARPVWLAGLLVRWAKLHGSFVYAALVAAPLALEALVEARRNPWHVVRAWGIFAAACLVAVLLTPNGVEAL